MAVKYGQKEALLKLLQLGADKSIKSNVGNSPADLAVSLKKPQVTRGSTVFSWKKSIILQISQHVFTAR